MSDDIISVEEFERTRVARFDKCRSGIFPGWLSTVCIMPRSCRRLATSN